MDKSPHSRRKEKKVQSSERQNPILIIDKVGVVGGAFCQKLAKKSLVVFATSERPSILQDFSNVIIAPYERKIPSIPFGTYSQILLFDDGEGRVKDFLPSLIEKAKEDDSFLILFVYLRKLDEKFIDSITASYKKIHVAIYGDIFARAAIKKIPEFDSVANELIYQATDEGKIDLVSDGLLKIHPIFIDDLVASVINKVFDSISPAQVYRLFPKHSQTQLSFAHMLQKPNPEIRIDFISSQKQKLEDRDFAGRGLYLLADKYPLADRLKLVDLKQKIDKEKNERKSEANGKKENFRRLFYRFLIFIFVLLLLPPLTTFTFFLLGTKELLSFKTAIDKGGLMFLENSAKNAKAFFSLSEKSLELLLWEAKFLGASQKINFFSQNLNFGKVAASSALEISDAVNLLTNVFTGKSQNGKADFDKGRALIKNAVILFKRGELEGNAMPVASYIKSFDALSNLMKNTLDVWPEIFGFNVPKNYLILFQNNMELRPGGGFIGSYATFTVDGGRISEFSLNDVYDADGQLKGHVEPPYPLRRFLPTAHLYLRDSNFDFDFVKAASSSAFMLRQETGKVIDGVIAIDLSSVRSLIGALGEIDVFDYKEKVNKDNLFLLTQSHVEKNFFPGSTQKKDFLRSLFAAILARFENKNNISYLSLAQAINDSISQKHLLFAFSDPMVQNILSVNNFSSSLFDQRKDGQNKINDFLGISEANLGVNKANFFLQRKIAQKVTVSEEGVIEEQVTLYYFNESKEWPGGDYKNYLRIILPKTTLLGVKIDGEEKEIKKAITDPLVYEKKNFLPPQGLEVETTEEEGKTAYGFLVTVPAGKLKIINIKYTLSQKVRLGQKFSYNLRVFKQPGTEGYPFETSLFYPSSYKVVLSSQGLSQKDNFLFSSKKLLTDEEIFADLAQK